MQPIARRTRTRTRAYLALAALAIALASAGQARAAALKLVVQPILPAKQTRQVYGTLAAYLTRATGQPIELVTAQNFLTYWETMKRSRYDLVLDAAHFTDFRDERLGYHVLAKIPDTVSYSLVTANDNLLFGPDELLAKRVATLSPPSLGAVRLAEMFPHPLRQPILVRVTNSVQAIRLLQQGKVEAAMVPTPLLNEYNNLNVVTTTAPVPHIALSAGPRVDARTRESIRRALVNADKTPRGRHMLQVLKFPKFVAADNAIYKGYAHLLKGMWGY